MIPREIGSKRRLKSCLIIRPERADVDILTRALAEKGVSWEDVPSSAPVNEAITDWITRRAQASDFACVILPDGPIPPMVWFEVGIVRAFRKPLFIVTSGDVPIDIAEALIVRSFSLQVIRVHLDAFLSHARSAKPLRAPRKIHPKATRQWTLDQSGSRTKAPFTRLESEAERSVLDAFLSEGAIEWTLTNTEVGPDLTVWLDALGGPLIVEVRERSDPRQVVTAQAQLLKFMRSRGAVAALLVLVSEGSRGDAPKFDAPESVPLVFKMTLAELLLLAKKRELVRTLIALRNRAIHGVE